MQIRTGSIRWDVAGTKGITHLDAPGGVVFGLRQDPILIAAVLYLGASAAWFLGKHVLRRR